MFTADKWKSYRLIDADGGERLEKWGDYTLIRPDPQIIWKGERKNPLWKKADGIYSRSRSGGGDWVRKNIPEEWVIPYGEMKFLLSPMGFKHTGLFPEQAANWDWMQKKIREADRPISVLNLFAYTGAASLAATAAGAAVTHLDSVRQVVTWAKGNMENSCLDNIRWVVEDALKFARREAKRGNVYQGIILDPPAYGHGPDGEKWKLDECLNDMLKCVSAILAPTDSFMVLNLYSNGFSAVLGETVVRQNFCLKTGFKEIQSGELVLTDSYGKRLPLSIVVRLSR